MLEILPSAREAKVPKGATILPGVWQMKRMCCILTREVYK